MAGRRAIREDAMAERHMYFVRDLPADDPPSEQAAKSRHDQIALAAFLRSEARGFAAGYEVDDWLAAEREIDTRPGDHSAGQEGSVVPASRRSRARSR
jgi:hypothetical protein